VIYVRFFDDDGDDVHNPLGPYEYANVTCADSGSGVSLIVGHLDLTGKVVPYTLAFFEPGKQRWIDDGGYEHVRFEVTQHGD